MMKKLMFAFLVAFTAFLVVACNQECPEPEECPEVPECEKCKECDECKECPEIPECKQDYVAPESFELYDDIVVVGVAKQLIYEDFSPKGAYEGLLWESSNEEYATVDQNGVVTGVRPGSVMIKATSVLNKEVYREVEIIIQDAVVDPFEVVKRETQYILSQIPVYAAADFDFPKPWNETVQVKFELDGVEVTKFEIPEGLTEDKALDYSLTISYGDNTVTENVKVWAVTDINVNAYTRVETAKQTAANLLAVYTVVGDKVSGDIALPEYIYGVKMNWNSSLKSALSAEGVYNRPLDDKTVTLDITCAYGAYSSTAAYSVVVKGYDADEKVDYILTEGSLAALNGAKVNTSLALPKYDSKFDVKLSYTSGNTAIYDNDGKLVAAPAEDTEVVFTVKAVYNISNGQNFEKEFELKVIATAENEASKAAEKWLAESGFNKEVHFPYGTEKGNVLDVPTAYEGAEVKWDVEGAKLYSKGHEAEVNAFELTEEGKPELVVQYLRYTQVQIKATFTAGEAKAEVVVLLNIGISASAENIYSGTWRNTAQRDGSLTVEQGLYDVVNNVSYFDAPLSYAGDNYGGYMWSGYSFTVTTAEGKTYEDFVMEYMTAYIREDANGNLYVDAANIYSGDGGNWGVFFVNTTNKDFVAEVGTYAASGQVFSDGVDCDNQGNRTGLTFDGYANGFVADATGKVLVGCQGGKLQAQIPSTDKTQFTSASGSKYTASFVTIPAGGYGMSWKYQFYGVGAIAAISPYAQIGAQLTITKHDVHPLNDYDATQATANLEAAESTIAMNNIANNASLENNIIKARNLYNGLEGATKANVFAEERLVAAETATAALIDAEIVALLADETAAGFTTKLGQLYTRLNKLTEQVASKLTKKADFDARYDYYASIDLTVTLDYDGGYAMGYYKAGDYSKVIFEEFLPDLYAHLVEKGAFQKAIVEGALVDDPAGVTPTLEEFCTPDYLAKMKSTAEVAVLDYYLFTPKVESDKSTVNENYRDYIEGSDRFFNTEKGQKWIDIMNWVDEGARGGNFGGQDAWGRYGENYQATEYPGQVTVDLTQYQGNPVAITNSGTNIGTLRFSQYIQGQLKAPWKEAIPENIYFTTFDRQQTQENYSKVIYHCTDGAVALPEAAYKEGYEFLGWFFEDGSEAVITGSMFKDVTVKAKWLAKLETSIEALVGQELEAVYYGDGGKNLWYQSTTPAGDLTTQNANVGIGNRAVVVDGKLFIMPKYALIELGKDATEDVTLKEKAELQPYGVDETQNSTGLIYDAATDTVKSQNSYGHGALYVNAGQKNVTIEAIELAYGRSTVSGTAYGYHKYVFELNAETGKYTAKLAGANGTVTLKPGDYLWCPMTADRFCSGLTDCDGTSGVVGVLADGKEVQVLDISGLIPAEQKWVGVEFFDGKELLKGTYVDAEKVAVVAPAQPSKLGYDFVGWATKADATAEEVVELPAETAEHVKYYAVWLKAERFAEVTVDAASDGSVPQTYATLAEALNHVLDNAVITIKAGTYDEEGIVISRPLTIVGANASTMLTHASEFAQNPETDTVIVKGIEIAEGVNNVKIEGVVMNNQITLKGNENVSVVNVICADVKFDSTLDGAIRVMGPSKNVVLERVYFAGQQANRGVHVNALTTDFTMKSCAVLDNVTGLYDFIRFGQSNTICAAGTVTVKDSYIRSELQSGFMDRKPAAAKYVFEGNTFVNTPAAIYIRAYAEVQNVEYVVQYNKFVNCGDIPGDWDAIAITNSDTCKVSVNYNAFVGSFPKEGTNTDYIIKVRNAAGQIDCANNYFDTEAHKAMNLNATGLTFLADEAAWKQAKVDNYGVTSIDEVYEELIKDFYAYLKGDNAEFESWETFKAGFDSSWAAGNKYGTYDDKFYAVGGKDLVDDAKGTFANSTKYAPKWMAFFNAFDEVVKDVNPSQSSWSSAWTGLMRLRNYFGKGTFQNNYRNQLLIDALNASLKEIAAAKEIENVKANYTKVGEFTIEQKNANMWSADIYNNNAILYNGYKSGASWAGLYMNETMPGLYTTVEYKATGSVQNEESKACDWCVICFGDNKADYDPINNLGIQAGDIVLFDQDITAAADGSVTIVATVYRAK